MTSSVASSVTTARCAYAASPVRRSTEVREFCARRFSDARRDDDARDARRRRRWECDVTLDGARAGASRARRTRGGARARRNGAG
jgi:hypothetical protein